VNGASNPKKGDNHNINLNKFSQFLMFRSQEISRHASARDSPCTYVKINPMMSYLNAYSVDSAIRFKSPNNTEGTVALRPEVIL
jgi:hypothetical protein